MAQRASAFAWIGLRRRGCSAAGLRIQRIGCAFTGRGGAPWRTSVGVQRVAGVVGQRRFARRGDGRRRAAAGSAAAPLRQVVQHVQQVVLAALVGAAVALDQAAAQRDLVAEPPVARACRATTPSSQCSIMRLLVGEAAAAHAQPAAARPAVRSDSMPNTEWRADLQRQRPGRLALAHALRSQAITRCGQRRRQQRRELGHAGLEVVVDLQHVVVAGLHLAAARAASAAGAALEVGHAHDVVEGHPQRQPARHLARGGEAVGAGRVGRAFGRQHRLQALDVERRRSRRPGSRAGARSRARASSCTGGGKRRGHVGRQRRCGARLSSALCVASRLRHAARPARAAALTASKAAGEAAQAGGGHLVDLLGALVSPPRTTAS